MGNEFGFKYIDDFGSVIKIARKDKGYKRQEDFAGALGVSTESVRNWEQNRALPGPESLFKICEVLDLDVDYLLGRLEHRTHDIQYIQDYTGLSAEAIDVLHNFSQDGSYRIEHWPELLSLIITHKDFRRLMTNISDYILILDSEYQQTIEDIDHDILDMTGSGLFHTSRVLTNILEDLGSRDLSYLIVSDE